MKMIRRVTLSRWEISADIAALEAVDDSWTALGSLAYVFCPRQGLHWGPFGRSVEKSVNERLHGLQQRLQKGRHKLQNYPLPGGGAIVETGAKEFAGELHHEQPLIYCNGSAIIILYGFLSNVEELLKMAEKDAASPSFFRRMQGNASLSSRRFQSQSFAAEALLQVYLQTKCSNLLIMLSELQGQYSFVIYDSNKRQVFAARDPGGQQPLYFAVDEDNSAAFVNKPINVPGGEALEDWQEVPPGHYVAGKTPKLQQFALTPDQLFARQSMDLTEDEGYIHQSDPIPIKRKIDHTHSMNSTLKSQEALDPMFAMSF